MAGASMVALITGASSGIGREFAGLLAEARRDLFLVARSADRLEEVAHELSGRFGVVVHTFPIDLTEQVAVDAIVDAVRFRGLEVDLLINNAGFGLLGSFHDSALDDQRDLVRLNIEAVLALTHRFMKPMIQAGRGGILNVASMAAFTPGPLMAGYYASKAFVVSFTEALHCELNGTGVRVSALCPGPVPTGFQKRAGVRAQRTRALPQRLDARTVAKTGLDGLAAGKVVVVPGRVNKVLAWLSRLSPNRLTAKAVFKAQLQRLEGGLE